MNPSELVQNAHRLESGCAELQALAEQCGFTLLAYLIEVAKDEAIARREELENRPPAN